MIALVETLLVAWTALLGAVVGSFLNVVIARVPHGLSVVHPRSRCPRCQRPIAWYDNLPVLSWLLLRGRCRGCHLPISYRYPLVEGLVAVLAVVALERHGFSAAALGELVLVSLLVALLFIDLDTWLLPHSLTWPLLASGLLLAPFGVTAAPTFASAALGAGIGFAGFALVSVGGAWAFKKEALGFGDVWLLAGIGAWLGVAALLPVVLFASLQGSVVGIALMLLGKGQPGPQLLESEVAPSDAPPPPAEPAEVAQAASAGVPAGLGGDAGVDGGAGAEEDWVPPRNAVPFGPFLALATFEWLYAGAWLTDSLPFFRVFR